MGRTVGAIGIRYPVSITVEAESENEAKLKAYDTHEHISDFRVTPVEGVTIEQIHAMAPKERMKFFRRASKEQIEELTEPCPGEAHANAHIDYCMSCLGVIWGRKLKPLPGTNPDATRIIVTK
jgi:hypothetical protein